MILHNEVFVDVIHGRVQVRQNLCAEFDHPGITVLEGKGREGDDELAEIVGGAEAIS